MRILSKSFWIKFFIYDAIFFLTLYGTIIFTFPIDEILKSNQSNIESKINYKMEFQKASIGFDLSLNFKNIQLTPIEISQKDKEDGVESIKIKSLEINPYLMKIYKTKKGALSFNAQMFGGEIFGEFEVREAPNQMNQQVRGKKRASANSDKDMQESNYLKLSLKKVSLTDVSSFFKMKLPIHGTLSGDAETYTGTSRGKVRFFSVESDLVIKNGKLGEGKVKTNLGDVTMPQVKLGDISLVAKMDKNILKLEPIDIKSEDLEGSLEGNIGFGMVVNPNLKMKYKFTDSFLATNKKINSVLTGLNLVKSRDGFYQYQITGTLDKPKFNPIR